MLTSLKKKIKRNPWFWYTIRNKNVSKKYSQPEGAFKKIVDGLKTNGITTSQFRTVFPDLVWDDFKKDVYKAINDYETSGKVIEHDDKSYMNFVLGLEPTYIENSVWAKVANHQNLKTIADAYFKMKGTQMRYYNIWKHEPSEEAPKGSQLWHRDREDVKILKVFICMEDVTEQKGPFTYAPGTHMEGPVKKEADFLVEKTGPKRTTDDMMNKLVPKENWIKSVGNEGTIVFADTNGYHKGGEVKEGYRLLFTCMYVSPACERFYFKTR